jgi:uncharacterized protein YqgV (UPF0045/DUF77 family)
MVASAQIAIYPLRQERLTPAVRAVQQALRSHGLAAQPGPMSTYVVGEADAIFAALRDALVQAAATGHVVMAMTVSNACPLPE